MTGNGKAMTALNNKLDRKSLEIMYHSFVLPTLEYASVIWDNCDSTLIDKVEKIHKKRHYMMILDGHH